jgi:hypothetical protein
LATPSLASLFGKRSCAFAGLADLGEVPESLKTTSLVHDAFFKCLVSEAWTDWFSLFEAIGNGLRQAVHAYGNTVDSGINDALIECVTAEADEDWPLRTGFRALGCFASRWDLVRWAICRERSKRTRSTRRHVEFVLSLTE